MWRRNVTRNKTDSYALQLEEKLFFLNPYLCDALLKHRKLCYEMESLRFIDLKQKQVLESQTLEQFKHNQEQKRKTIR